MELTYGQKREILESGFTVIPGVIPEIMIRAALKAINHSIGEGIDLNKIEQFRAQSYCQELQQTPVIMDLINKTPALALAESAIGPVKPIVRGQVALRFPRMTDRADIGGGHIDGMHSPTNGVPRGTIKNFTGLAVLLLSDLPETYSGNFTVYPRTHLLYQDFFRRNNPEKLMDGMPPIEKTQPVQVTGKAGDLVLTHYQLAHTAGPNLSPFIRYAVIFRLFNARRGTPPETGVVLPEAMTDIWMEWDGIRKTFSEAERNAVFDRVVTNGVL